MNAVMIGATYTFQFSEADMKERYGNNSLVGGFVGYKTKKNVIIGLEGNFLFGGKIKEPQLFQLISVDGINFITPDGTLKTPEVTERGFVIKAYAGKIIPFAKPNKNSGILVTMGIGFIQHRIKINYGTQSIPYLSKEYLKGYDRMTNGVILVPFLGYQYMSLNRRINFYAGFEATVGFTKGVRKWNFDTNTPGDGKRLDVFLGLKAAWVLPIYLKSTEKYFYY